MLELSMTVNYQDERTVKVTVLPVTQVAFERHFKCAFAAAFNEDVKPSFEHIYFIAWHAARSGLEFDPWLETVAGIEFGEATPVDPTNPAPLAGE
jgi:hypothetical protein